MMSVDELEKYRKAGRIAAEAREYGIKLVKENASLADIAEQIEQLIKSRGGKPAFPVNISINNTAAHFTPKSEDKIKFRKGDVVKIDVGAHVDGYIGDTAGTVEVNSDKYSNLLKSAREALSAAIELIHVEADLSIIGGAIEQTICAYGYKSVENLTGHSLARYRLHAGKSVPNIKTNVKEKLISGDVIAVEPFATNGSGRVKDCGLGNIYRFVRDRTPRSNRGKIMLSYIKENFGTLPFAERWCSGIVENHNSVLKELMKEMIIAAYPVLKEIENSVIAQAEHTVIVMEKGCEVIT